MKPLTTPYTLARLRHHVLPLLGNRRATDVSSGDIERFAADVPAEKTAKNDKVGDHGVLREDNPVTSRTTSPTSCRDRIEA